MEEYFSERRSNKLQMIPAIAERIFLRTVRIVLFFWCFNFILAGVSLALLGKDKLNRMKTAAVWTQRWAKCCAAILKMKITTIGDPEQLAGKLAVSSHTGCLDIICQGTILKLRFAPKQEMRHWPVFGWLTALSQPIWIDRKNRQKAREAAAEIAFTIRNGLNILVYPEGTSTDGNSGLLPFKSTAFEPAIQSGCAITPILIFHKGLPENSAETSWHGDMGFLPYIWGILGLKEIHSRMYIMPEVKPLPGEDRKSFSCRVHDMMEEYYWRVKEHDND